MDKIRAGFIGFGEVNTPRELIEKKCSAAMALLEAERIELVSTAPVSDDPQGADARRVVAELSGKQFDVLVVCVAGWIPTYAVISAIHPFRHLPMVLWGLTGYYENGRLVTTADQAGTTALRKVMEDMGFLFRFVYNTPAQKASGKAIGNIDVDYYFTKLRYDGGYYLTERNIYRDAYSHCISYGTRHFPEDMVKNVFDTLSFVSKDEVGLCTSCAAP